MDKNLLLTSVEMAQFASTGFLRFDNLVPRELCELAYDEMSTGKLRRRAPMGSPFSESWPDEAIGKVFRLPKVAAIIHSLVGPNPRYDHHAAHLTPANTRKGANLHQDAEYDVRDCISIFRFPFFQKIHRSRAGVRFLCPARNFGGFTKPRSSAIKIS